MLQSEPLIVEIPYALTEDVIDKKIDILPIFKSQIINRKADFIKTLDFYIFLKAQLHGAPLIKNYINQISILSEKFRIPLYQFFYYMEKLELLNLLNTEGANIRVAGWKQLGRLLEISTAKRNTVIYYYDPASKIPNYFGQLNFLIDSWILNKNSNSTSLKKPSI
jgi:hypothetical protein